jgi:hypothetical protein
LKIILQQQGSQRCIYGNVGQCRNVSSIVRQLKLEFSV